jgi:hypothetical protein
MPSAIEEEFYIYPVVITDERSGLADYIWSAGTGKMRAHGNTIVVAMAQLGARLAVEPEYVALESLVKREVAERNA